MADSTGVLLALALVGVYLFDSASFLCVGEAMVASRGRRLVRVQFGARFELAGRRVWLPNPFTPFRPAFRIDWDLSGRSVNDAVETGQQMRDLLQAIGVLRVLASLCGALAVIVAPAALLLRQEPLFLAAVVACFALAITSVIVLSFKRKALGLKVSQVCTLGFVAIVCIPCAPNLPRAIALQRQWTLAASELPQLGFAPADLPAVHAEVHAALSNARRFVPEDGPHLAVIEAQLRKLEERRT
jgi:hypothetical protein